MKCPICNAWTSVKATRGVLRRRECANGHRFSTKEVCVAELDMAAYQSRIDEARATLRAQGYLK